MTPEAQRIAIAEACGWKDVQRSSLNPSSIVGRKPDAYDIEGRTYIPDYLSDLNAMHEAEETCLTNDKLRDEMGSNLLDTSNDVFPLWHATASERAEAFLRTLNLWTENESS